MSQPVAVADSSELREIDNLTRLSELRWRSRLTVDRSLSRSLVSFQANRTRSVYRWFKFKEAFSADLVEFLLNRYQFTSGTLLDPFAGSGTAMFAAGSVGMCAEGVELLPIGQQIIATKMLLERGLAQDDLKRLAEWCDGEPWKHASPGDELPELRITRAAYASETHERIRRYLTAVTSESPDLRQLLLFALLCILESISFTRKDGQYLRWDHRAGRRHGTKLFDKGEIPAFDQAMVRKLRQITEDLQGGRGPDGLFESPTRQSDLVLHKGSCLTVLPSLPASRYDCVMTSPPYCNRYDYTRTYALELALLNVDEAGLSSLRQQMLSCTVENKAKDLLSINPAWHRAIAASDDHELLHAILAYLEAHRVAGKLNNPGIPRMIRGYFYEMACVISECSRLLKSGGRMLMVNDNVRYAGVSIPVDIILSEMAEMLGFDVESVLVLPSGKGNSSQQMGTHGRESLRKCVYVWRKI